MKNFLVLMSALFFSGAVAMEFDEGLCPRCLSIKEKIRCLNESDPIEDFMKVVEERNRPWRHGYYFGVKNIEERCEPLLELMRELRLNPCSALCVKCSGKKEVKWALVRQCRPLKQILGGERFKELKAEVNS